MATLKFDCALGIMTITDSKGSYSIPATSGNGACLNNVKCRDMPWKGPIPSGMYYAFRSELSNPSFLRDWFRNQFRGNWRDWRVPLRNISGGPCNSGRGGFYIHGGDLSRGSAGCICVGGDAYGNAASDRVLRSLKKAEWSVVWVE